MKDVNPGFHYAWVIVLTGMAVLFSCLGLGRFSLGMLLPSMGTSLNLSYSQMGLIGTGNFVGYMIAVILAGTIARTMGARQTIFLGLVFVGASMVWISRSMGYTEILLLYLVTGIGSGLANVPLMGLVSHWFLKSTRGRAAGTMLSGNGIAIVFAGICIPWINSFLGAEGWRTGWMAFGMISLFVAAMAGLLLRNHPQEKGLAPLGTAGENSLSRGAGEEENPHRRTMVHLGGIYFLFGATYAVYATFIVTAMVKEMGFGENTAGNFWAVVGALSIFSGPLLGWLSDRLGRRAGIMIVFALFTLSYALVAAGDLLQGFLYASIGIFGLTVWSVPTIMSATVGDYAGPAQAAKAFGFITLFFGVGQITGPAIAGVLADFTGTFRTAFWLSALLTGMAVVMAYFLRPPSDSPS